MIRDNLPVLTPLLSKVQRWQRLDEKEQAALLELPHSVAVFGPGKYLVREGEAPPHASLLLSGFAFRHKSTGNGARSIHAVHMAGDFVDLQNCLLTRADHSVQTLGKTKVALIQRQDILRLAREHPNVALALWQDTLVDASIFREWITNVSRRDAATRIAHLLCELGVRLELHGVSERDNFELPLTQEQLADATALTAVHVNRTLMDLERDGLFTRTARFVVVPDWHRLAKAGDFDTAYLHLPVAA